MHRRPQTTRVLARPHLPLPADVRHALVGHGVLGAFKERPPNQQDACIAWVTRARLDASRAARIVALAEALHHGERVMRAAWRSRKSA